MKDAAPDGTPRVQSRIDRALINVPMPEARDFRCHGQTVDDLGNRSLHRDHVNTRSLSQIPGSGTRARDVQSWRTKHQVFCSIFKCLHDERGLPLAMLSQPVLISKLHVGKATTRSRSELLWATPTSHGAKLLAAATAMRAYRSGHPATLMRRCEAWEQVEHCSDGITFEYGNFHEQNHMIASLTRGSKAEREDSIHNMPWTQTEKDKALAKCRRSQRAWCAKKPRLTFHAVTNEESRTLDDAEGSGARLCSHWCNIILKQVRMDTRTILVRPFSTTSKELLIIHNGHDADGNLMNCLPPKKNPHWVLLVSHTAFTGVPVAFGAQLLFNAYKQLLAGGGLPPLFPAGGTLFINESTAVDDHGRIVRSPFAPQLLTLCNCDCEILTSDFFWIPNNPPVNCAYPAQR